MIGETSRSNISQALWDALANKVKPMASIVKKRVAKKYKDAEDNDPVSKQKRTEFYKKVVDKQNSNLMLRANRKGENKPKTVVDDEKEHKVRGPQKNPNPIKIRSNKWLDGFEERNLGSGYEMYGMEKENGKRIIVINKDHPFYQKFYSRLDEDSKFLMAQIISCQEIARQVVNYYTEEDTIGPIIDCYEQTLSAEVKKSLSF
jgi:hypothetical protein